MHATRLLMGVHLFVYHWRLWRPSNFLPLGGKVWHGEFRFCAFRFVCGGLG